MANLETLAWGYTLIEGPRVDAEDNLYFSDVHAGGVYRRSPDGEITTAVPKRRGVGGIALHADGGLVVSGRTIQHVSNGVSRDLFGSADIAGFNDLMADATGRVWTGSMLSSPFEDELDAVFFHGQSRITWGTKFASLPVTKVRSSRIHNPTARLATSQQPISG